VVSSIVSQTLAGLLSLCVDQWSYQVMVSTKKFSIGYMELILWTALQNFNRLSFSKWAGIKQAILKGTVWSAEKRVVKEVDQWIQVRNEQLLPNSYQRDASMNSSSMSFLHSLICLYDDIMIGLSIRLRFGLSVRSEVQG